MKTKLISAIALTCLLTFSVAAQGTGKKSAAGRTGSVSTKAMRAGVVSTKETQAAMTAQQALQALKDGNARFVAGKSQNQPHYRKQVAQTAKGQYPNYAILSCLDSRVSVDDIFDLNNGDAFNARVAGNVANEDILGSFEFATAVSGADVIVVLGHTNCGAVKGACDGVELGNLTGLLDKIEPAVEVIGKDWMRGAKNSKNHDFVEAVGAENVRLQMNVIREKSSVIKGLLDSGKAVMVGAIYDLETGQVTFLK